MKSKFLIIALAAIIGFGAVSCGGDPGDSAPGNNNSNNNTLKTKNLTIAGTFDSASGAGQAQFYAFTSDSSRSASRAIGASDYELDGYLEDDGITLRLKGNYNTDTKTYALSAAGNLPGVQLRYTLSGKFNDSGKAETGKAVVQIKTGTDDWVTFEVIISPEAAAPEINITNAIDDTVGGIPLKMRGIWRDTVYNSFYALVNAFSVVYYEKAGNTWIEFETMYFTDITDEGGDKVSGITAYWDWDWNALQKDNPNVHSEMLNDYYTYKNPGKTPIDVWEIRQLYLNTQMEKPDDQNYILTYMLRENGPHGNWYDTDSDGVKEWWPHVTFSKHEGWNLAFSGNHIIPDGFDNDICSCQDEERKSEDHKKHLQDRIDKYPALSGIAFVYYHNDWQVNGGHYVDFDQSMKDYQLFMDALDAEGKKWASQNGYIVIDHESMFKLSEEMRASGYDEDWIVLKYGANGKKEGSDYWKQWYSKMKLKIQNGKLFYGLTHTSNWKNVKKTDSGSWEIINIDDYENTVFPEYVVNDYSLINTLTVEEWLDFSLSR